MPGELGEDARFYLVFRIGAAVEVLGIQCLAARMRDEVLIEQLEIGLGELPVAVPPHGILGQRIDDGVLVLGRAAGMHAGLRAQRAAVDDMAFAIGDGVLVEHGRGVVPMDRLQAPESRIYRPHRCRCADQFPARNSSSRAQPLAAAGISLKAAASGAALGRLYPSTRWPATYSRDPARCQDRSEHRV